MLIGLMAGLVGTGFAQVTPPLKFPTGTWKLRPNPITRAEFRIPQGSVVLQKQGSRLVVTSLSFTVPADTERSDCPFPRKRDMRLAGTLLVPRQKVPKSAGLTTTSWDGWRRGKVTSGGDSYGARLYFFFPGNGYGPPKAAPGPYFTVEVGGCQYRATLHR